MSTTRHLTVTIAADPPNRLDKALARDVSAAEDLSRSRLMRLIADGSVRRDGQVLDSPKARVSEGDVLELTVTTGDETDLVAEDIPLSVVFEDADLIVVDKPVGMVVHPAPGSPSGTLVNALMAHCGDSLSGIGGERRPGIVHRIDKDTSGLLVVAKTDKAHHGLAAQFEAHTVTRHYRAVVHGVPDAGDPRLRGLRGVGFEPGNILRIATLLGRHPADRQKQAVQVSKGRRAVTRARVVEAFGDPEGVALIDCWLETGRTHQIRVHMAHAGHGLIGDQTYGGRRRMSAKAFSPAAMAAVDAFPRQALHAASLGFIHPVTGVRHDFDAPLPPDMEQLILSLR
ncbi:pseudouridine synthase [Pseudoruegeria sp. SK021]|uniref:pseudouridine synthase n=1 Tax=Pseudoruegeria sp. SK021 TaxID=1933035 RepID=UPI000A2648A6|nr:pseudouridine synthase [Pseudoruegeria sp. SK021]OSP56401.1 RNA pseudouridine synthase [Pseudoruegeria sp. SK021]